MRPPVVVRSLSSIIIAALIVAALSTFPACTDLKTATPSDGASSSPSTTSSSGASSSSSGASASSGSTSSSGSSSSTSSSGGGGGGFGPGPHGSLPSGFCCQSDDQCRYRHCVDVNGSGKMCLDACDHDGSCQRPPDFNFTCDNVGSTQEGFCKPPGASFMCIPASKFERGTKVPGNCCTATRTGLAGLECEGALCVALGDGPFVCSNACSLPADCSGPFTCQAEVGRCVPANQTYTCN
jgi:hypothetical protein